MADLITIQVAFDAADPHAAARFWSAALGYDKEDHSQLVQQLLDSERLAPEEAIQTDGQLAFRDVAASSDPSGARPRLFFQRVPEGKTVKNRVHLDLHVGPERLDAEVARLQDLGATFAWSTQDRGPRNVTLRDPQGNEFCVS